jgi:6-phosphogluconolactonase
VNLTRRSFLAGVSGLSLAGAGKQYLVYWGTYTAADPRFGGKGESEGIYVSRFDAGTGSLTRPQLAGRTSNPSYLVVHPNRRFLYAVNEEIDQAGKAPGGVSAFSIDGRTGELTLLNRVSSNGVMPCHICTDKTGSVVAVANWGTGSTVVFPIRRDGSLGEHSGFHQHMGERSGAKPARGRVQPHCHSVNVTPDNRFLVATDTGLNKVFVFRLDVGKAAITPHDPPFLGLEQPANPRQLAWHPNGRWAYVVNEANPGATMLHYDRAEGAFKEGPVARTVPEEYTERVSPAEIAMHPSGRLLFVSNRGHDSIATLRIDPSTGSHTRVDVYQPGGSGPRSFGLDPTGAYLIALMQRSDAIIPLRVDQQTGKLSSAGEKLDLPAPVCARFLGIA